MESLEQVVEAPSIVGGAAQHSSRKACSALEDETLAGELPGVAKAPVKASLTKAIGAPPLRAKKVWLVVHGAQRPPDRLVLSSYVKPMEWARPIEDELAP